MDDARTAHPYVNSRFEHQLEMVHPLRACPGPAEVPPGYLLRSFRDGDEPAYAALFRLAWPDEGTLAHTRAHALPGGLLVIEHAVSGHLVGSCVAFGPTSERHPHDGGLGWLVVDPAHGRRGLGTALATAVTRRAIDAGYTLPWLGTEDDRLAAIGIYLRLGWQPHLHIEGMKARWHAIYSALGREFLASHGVEPPDDR